VLLRAYFAEYSIKDDVALVLLTNAYHSNDDFAAQALALATEWGHSDLSQLPTLIFHPTVAQQQLPQLYQAAHCFVLPSRGEGWGRPHVEAMAMGLPVIATNWSGPTEYLNAANGYLLPISKDLVAVPASSAFAGHLWADPDPNALCALMRHVQTHRAEAAAKGARARADMVAQYAPAVLAKRVGELLRDLVGGRPEVEERLVGPVGGRAAIGGEIAGLREL
jgi:glycosyltransferase involved in cell wall biosynthesis